MTEGSKIATLATAARLIPDSAVVGIGGNSQSRKPMALLRELIRQGRSDLTVVTFLGGIDVELLLSAGCVKHVRAAYVGLDLVGLAPIYASTDPSRCLMETEASLVYGLRATAAGVPFFPSLGTLHTDVAALRTDVARVACPYTGQQLMAWPALKIDYALIHTSWSTPLGTAGVEGAPVLDRLLSEAADHTIVTTEQILPDESPAGNVLVRRSRTTAVVQSKFGAHPTGCFPHYRQDIAFLVKYASAAKESGPAVALGFFPDSPSYEDAHVDPEQILVDQ